MRLLPLTVLAVVVVVGLGAFDANGAPGGELKDKAQQLLTDGNRLAAEGDFGAALVKFRTAHELYPSPKLLLNIGTSLRQIGRYAEAIRTYEQYLAHPEADPSRTSELRGIVTDLEELVGKLEISVGEPDVKVSVDGELVRGAGASTAVRVDPGRHTVVAEKEGREPAVRHLTIEARETKEIVLALAAPGQAAAEAVDLRHLAGWSLVAIGSAGVTAGIVLGAVAQAKRSEADAECATEGSFAGYCSPAGAELNDEARTLGGAALIAFVGGFSLAVAGVALVFTDDEEPGVTASLELRPGPALGVGVRW